MYPASQDIHHERKYATQVAYAKFATFDEYVNFHHLWHFAPEEQEELRVLYEAPRVMLKTTPLP